jgi:hypothetical protein
MVTDTAAEHPGARREGLLPHHPLVFFIIAYAARRWSVDAAAMPRSSAKRREVIDVSTAA